MSTETTEKLHPSITMPRLREDIAREMIEAAQELLGRGYVRSYYISAAGDFIDIGEHNLEYAYRLGLEHGAAKEAAKRPKNPLA